MAEVVDEARPAENGRPDPAVARTPAEFVDAMRRLRNWTGLGYRTLEKRAAAAGYALPRSTLMAVLSRRVLPREDLVVAFVHTCGGDDDEVLRWISSRRRIAAAPTEPAGPTEPTQPTEPTGPIEPARPAATATLEPARCTLPADAAVFVGREKEVEQIAVAVSDAAQYGGVIAIHAIDGMPGIGKTTLAVHVAHQLTPRFGDRQLYVNLHAHTPGQDPADPADALAELLAADGVDPRVLPSTVDGRAALWRDRMVGRRMLLVLDNAASTEQVVPLLPGATDCLVLVTSRRSLGDLPAATPLRLDVLAPDEAMEMFVRLAPRAAAHPDAVGELVRACGYLPLAISITASLYLRHPSWTMGDLVREVNQPTGGVLTVSAENRTVATVFSLSYQHLPPDRQRFFRMLGMHPGVDIDPYAAAALTGTTLEEAQRQLDALHGDHLLDEPAYHRYRMHDLIRAHAQTLAAGTDTAGARQQAVRRLLDFYEHTAARADAYLSRYSRPPTTVRAPADLPEIMSWDEAAAWLRAERPNLLACIHHATATGQHARTVGLTAGLAGLLVTDGPWAQAAQLHQAAAEAAERLGNPGAQAGALHDLGVVRRQTGDYRGAEGFYRQAQELYLVAGDRHGQAHALAGMGGVRWLTGDYPAAIGFLGQAIDLYRTLHDRRGEGNTLVGLAAVHVLIGDYVKATEFLEQAIDVHRSFDNRRGEGIALHGLGVIKRQTGDYTAAAHLFQRAIDVHRALDDRRAEGIALHGLGVVKRRTGDYAAARDLHERALDRYRKLDDLRGQAINLHELGNVRRETGDHAAARELYQQAQELYRTLGDRHGQAVALVGLGVVASLSQDYAQARDLLDEALASFREIGAPDDEAEALNHLATVNRLMGQPGLATTLHHQALEIAARIHLRLEQAHALHGLGRAAMDVGDNDLAATYLGQALDLYRGLGVPQAAQVVADLTTLKV